MDKDTLHAVRVGAVVVAAIIALSVFGYWVDRTFFYPQIRQNTIENPDRSIANRKYFHDSIMTILGVDHQIDTLQAQMTTFKADHRQPWDDVVNQQYGDLQTQLIGLQEIRSQDIGDYNSHADNPDTGRDRDACLPAHIDPSESVAYEEQALAAVQCP